MSTVCPKLPSLNPTSQNPARDTAGVLDGDGQQKDKHGVRFDLGLP